MTDSRSLITELITSFGNPGAIEALLAEDATWWITPTVGVLGSPTTGRAKIREAMDVIFGDLYEDATTEIHAVISDGAFASARFTLRARALFAAGRPYENEYCLWIEQGGEHIIRVWEYLDVANVAAQFDVKLP